MSPTAKYRFSTPQRFGVWLAHGSRCFWCERPIEFRDATVDHVVAESVQNKPKKLQALRDLYALGDHFHVNDYENWVPSHGICNGRKGVHLEPSASAAMIEIFRRLRSKASAARRIAKPFETEQPRSKVFARILTAIENGTVTADDIRELLSGHAISGPVTIADWEATPAKDSYGDVDVHRAPRYPGWTRINFDEQVGIEDAFLGQSMGPRHVEACPRVPEVREIVSNLERLGAVAVTGDSGCGKSIAAWHAAHELSKRGWDVYLLTNPAAAVGDLPRAEVRALLVVDDAQSLAGLPVRAATADSQRAVVAISTVSVPGFRVEVRLAGKRCVEAVAASLREREAELLPILARLEPHLGPRAMDARFATHVDDARRRSEYPWQFMFNLGGGHRRLEAKLDAVVASEPLDRLLYTIAAYQIATLDAPCPIDWLLPRQGIGIRGAEELHEQLKRLASHIELVKTVRGVATPHPRVAAVVIRKLFYGTEAGAIARRELLWEVFRDPAFPLRGLRWLIDELPGEFWAWFGLSDELSRLLVARCYTSPDVAGAGLVLARLLSLRQPQSHAAIESIAEQERTIVRWIETCDAEQASGVQEVLNAIINHDRSRAQMLIDSANPLIVADRVQRATPSDGYWQAGLLGRLTFGSPLWRAKVVNGIDRKRLVEAFVACDPRDIGPASELIEAVVSFDEELGLELAQAILPAAVTAMREDARSAVRELRGALWFAFRLGPSLLGLPKPDERRVASVRGVLEEVGANALARAYQNASRRDWDGLDSVSTLLRQVAPDIAIELSHAVDVAAMLSTFAEMDAYEIDHVLVALALGETWEPAATVARLVCAPTGRMSWRAAAFAPDAAAEVAAAGGVVTLPLAGGLPRWRESTAALGSVYEKSPDAARTILRSAVADLSDGLVFRQSNGGKGALTFMKVAMGIDDESVVDAARAMDVATARASWTARAIGSDEERTVLAAFISIAARAGGDVAQLAQEVDVVLRTNPPPAGDIEPDDVDDDE